MGHLRLPEVGYHPQVGVINYIDQRLSRLHQLSFVDLLLAHHAVGGSRDHRVGEIESGHPHL